VGRLERRKGVEVLMEALPAVLGAVPETRVRLIGRDHRSGPGGAWMSGHLRELLREAGVPEQAVEFGGPVERTVLPETYRAAGICVVPSLYENFPYTCLEAMAAGCAVVASAVGGIPEIITDQVEGLLVPPGDPGSLASAILRLLRDPALRTQLGRQARAAVHRRFSRGVVCRQTADLYRSLLQQ
jgi:glycosyltransferase involved in cell wall biosynthesis